MYSTNLYHTPFSRLAYDEAKSIYLNQLSGSVNLIQQSTDYLQSNKLASSKSVIHMRDLFISLANSTLLDNSLYTQSGELSPHASQIDNYEYPLLTRQSLYSGELGTLAHYMQFVDNSDYPIDYIDRLLKHVWFIHGSSYESSTPKQRLDTLFRLLGIPLQLDATVQEAVSYVFSITDTNSELYPTLLFARRNYLTESDGANFTYKVLTGSYNKNILILLEQTLSRRKMELLNSFIHSVESVAKPAGIYLLLQSFTTEAYLKIAKTLNDLSDAQLIQNAAVLTTEAYASVQAAMGSYLVLAKESLQLMVSNQFINKKSELNLVNLLILAYTNGDLDLTNSLQGTLLMPESVSYSTSDFSGANKQVVMTMEGKIHSQITEVVKGYTLFNTLSMSELPRGSSQDRTATLGLSLPRITMSDATGLVDSYAESSLNNYTDTMLGFVTEQDTIHAGSEIAVLKEWLEALPI